MADLGNATVVIVDDEVANVRVLERVLRRAGVGDVHTSTDPREAVRLVHDVTADLLLLDLHMPHLDGFGVLADLRASSVAGDYLPVLVLTADVSPRARDRALEAGAQDLVHKPFDRNEVLLRVRNLLETRRLYNAVQRHNATLQAEVDRANEAARHHQALRDEQFGRIQAVLASNRLTSVYQPIADLRTGEVRGAEALSRFPDPPLRSPDLWFGEANEAGLGAELELAAVARALTGLDALSPSCWLSVNVSPDTAARPELLMLLDQHPAERVVIELTEHAPITDYGPLQGALDRLRDRGVRIAIDDTGAGYAGLRHLVSLRPDVIKLDIGLTGGSTVTRRSARSARR
ncbi:MAG: EAL domain-containing response regulator [Nitriliruptor sp.]